MQASVTSTVPLKMPTKLESDTLNSAVPQAEVTLNTDAIPRTAESVRGRVDVHACPQIPEQSCALEMLALYLFEILYERDFFAGLIGCSISQRQRLVSLSSFYIP